MAEKYNNNTTKQNIEKLLNTGYAKAANNAEAQQWIEILKKAGINNYSQEYGMGNDQSVTFRVNDMQAHRKKIDLDSILSAIYSSNSVDNQRLTEATEDLKENQNLKKET